MKILIILFKCKNKNIDFLKIQNKAIGKFKEEIKNN